MKKVEIELLNYSNASGTTTTTTTGNQVTNGDFSAPLGNVAQTGCQTCPGVYGGPAGTAMYSNPPISNMWRGYVSYDSGVIGSIGYGTPAYINSGVLHIPNQPTVASTAGNLVTETGIYQKITGMTPGQTYTLNINVISLPGGASLNDMNGVDFRIGIYGSFNNWGSPWNGPNNAYQSGAPGQYEYQCNDTSSAFGSGGFNDGCMIFDFNAPLTVGQNSIPFVWQNNPGQTDAILCLSVWGNSSLGGEPFQETLIELVEIQGTSTTTITTINSLRGVVGRLDLTDSANFPLSLNYAVADGNDFESVFGDYSTTFEVPATKTNQRLLGNIEDELMVDYKSITNFKDCRIIVDGVEMLRGSLKVTGTTQRKSPEFYTCVFYGGNADWGAKIKDLKMCDLVLEKGDGTTISSITYDYSQIEATWGSNPLLTDIVYPLVSYGDFYPGGSDGLVNRWNPDVENQDWRAWFYVYNLLEYIFRPTGYTIKSDFMQTNNTVSQAGNNPWFQRLITQFQWGKNVDDDLSEELGLEYTQETPITINTYADNESLMLLNGASAGGYTDSGWQPSTNTPLKPGVQIDFQVHDSFLQYSQDNYTGGATGKITMAQPGKMKLYYTQGYMMGSNWNGQPAQSGKHTYQLFFRIRKKVGSSTSTIASAQTPVLDCGGSSTASAYIVWGDLSIESAWEFVNQGDQVWVEARMTSQGASGNNNGGVSSQLLRKKSNNNGTYVYPVIRMTFDAQKIPIGSKFNPSDLLSCKVKQTDFIKAIAHMFNLHFTTNVSKKEIVIEPYDDFYLGKSQATDWTNKIDWSQQIVDNFGTGVKNEILFKYKEDSKDVYKAWKTNDLDLTYPFYSWYVNVPQIGNPGLSEFTNPLYDGTLMEYDMDVSGYVPSNTPPCIPVYEKELTVFGPSTSPQVDRPDKGFFGPKILYYDGYTTQGSVLPSHWSSTTGPASGVTQQAYPRAVFVDVTNTSIAYEDTTNLSYNDETREDGVVLPGLVNRYWVKMLQQLAKKPRVRTIFINLKLEDILALNFRKLLYLDGAYWRLLKVKDYAPAQNLPTQIEIVQWTDEPSYKELYSTNP